MAAGSFAGGPYTGRGAFRFTWNGARITAQIDSAIQTAMDETADAAKAEAQSRARVDTGAMRDSIDAVVRTTGGGRRQMVLSIGVSYGIFHELGTSRISAQPMIRPAIDQEAPRLTQRIRAAIGSTR
jgi:HK97 gp10 family phage protein